MSFAVIQGGARGRCPPRPPTTRRSAEMSAAGARGLRATYHRALDKVELLLPEKLRPLYNHPAGNARRARPRARPRPSAAPGGPAWRGGRSGRRPRPSWPHGPPTGLGLVLRPCRGRTGPRDRPPPAGSAVKVAPGPGVPAAAPALPDPLGRGRHSPARPPRVGVTLGETLRGLVAAKPAAWDVGGAARGSFPDAGGGARSCAWVGRGGPGSPGRSRLSRRAGGRGRRRG